VGAIVGIADKMDTLCGFFGVGLIPTGTADPYALRRQALGVINILLAKRYPLGLRALINEAISILGPLLKHTPDETTSAVLEFFKGRFENQLLSQGHPYDVVDSVLAAGMDHLALTSDKIAAMEAFKSHPDFQPLAISFKRVANIIRDFHHGAPNPDLFADVEENRLHAAFLQIRQVVRAHIDGGDYSSALIEMARLRNPVDAFFEKVMVMADDEKVRINRLSLLLDISTLFREVADFSKIVTEM
jgi:glycyl-tRNA synthetase beta chain